MNADGNENIPNGEDNEQDAGINDDRNVRPNLGIQRAGAFRAQVQLEMANFHALKGRLGGVEQSNRFDPERYNVISLQDHIQNGPQRRTVIVAMVLRINVDDKKAEAQKKYNGNARGASTTVQHSRRVLLMCLNSEAGHNTFTRTYVPSGFPGILQIPLLSFLQVRFPFFCSWEHRSKVTEVTRRNMKESAVSGSGGTTSSRPQPPQPTLTIINEASLASIESITI